MTRVRVLSDVHLEFGALDLRSAGEDVVALCGDIGLFTDGVQWADRLAGKLGVPVVMIAGNHEFYRHSERAAPASVEQILRALAAEARPTGGRVTFLCDEAAVVAGVRFVGATLWTDFALFGDAARAMAAAEVRMNDYRLIYRTQAERLHPSDTTGMHEAARLFLEAELSRPHDGPTVVMTHHPPSGRSIAGRYAEDDLSPAYASNLDEIVENSGAALWLHGHTHVSQDYWIGSTRVVCNPRGYAGYELNPDFDPNLVVAV